MKKLYGYQRLGRQEKRLIQLIAHGLTNKKIALQMRLSFKTVDVYRQSIYRKWDVHNSVQLLRKAVAFGYLPPDILTQKMPDKDCESGSFSNR